MRHAELVINLNDLDIYHPPKDKRINLVRDPRSFQIDGIWHIYPIATSRRQVYIICPYCGEIHRHGRDTDIYTDIYEGYRVPHCHPDAPNYKILRLGN